MGGGGTCIPRDPSRSFGLKDKTFGPSGPARAGLFFWVGYQKTFLFFSFFAQLPSAHSKSQAPSEVLSMFSVGRILRSSPRTTFVCSPPVSRIISFFSTCSLPVLLPWQARRTGNVGSEAANHMVSRPGRLCTSEIPKPLPVSLVITPLRHHLPPLPSEIGELRQNLY